MHHKKKADDPVFVIGKRIGARINDIILPLQIRLQHSEFLRKFEHKTRIKRHFVVLGLFVLFCLIVFAVVGSHSIVLCNHFLTSLLPLYLSFKSLPLSHKHVEHVESHTRPAMFWLCYWIFYMMTEQISMCIHWLSQHERAWWIVSYAFVTARFCALCLCVLADSELRDILYRQLIGALSRCAAPKSRSSSSTGQTASSSSSSPASSLSRESSVPGASLEEGLSRRNVQPETETQGSGDITRRIYEKTNNPYNNHVAT